MCFYYRVKNRIAYAEFRLVASGIWENQGRTLISDKTRAKKPSARVGGHRKWLPAILGVFPQGDQTIGKAGMNLKEKSTFLRSTIDRFGNTLPGAESATGDPNAGLFTDRLFNFPFTAIHDRCQNPANRPKQVQQTPQGNLGSRFASGYRFLVTVNEFRLHPMVGEHATRNAGLGQRFS